jgi:hypothetical protein
MEETVTISKKEYDELLEESKKLSALESWGVDNWSGYDEAMRDLRENEEY